MKLKVNQRWILFLLISIGLSFGLGATPVMAADARAGEFTLSAEYTEGMEPGHPYLTYHLGFGRKQQEAGVGFYADLNLIGDLRLAQSQIELGEVYAELHGENHELRVGRQRRAWGTALQINPTDNLNPPNPVDLFGEKTPVIMVAGDYYLSDTTTLTGVIIPFYQPAVDQVLLPVGPVDPQVAEPVPDDWANTQYALRIGGQGVYGLDYGLSYLYGFEALLPKVSGDRR